LMQLAINKMPLPKGIFYADVPNNDDK
jgi:hypothetical protein